MRNTFFRTGVLRFICALSLSAGFTRNALGQSTQCETSAQTVATGSPSSGLVNAYDHLMDCNPSYYTAALISSWGRATPREERQYREMVSLSLSDRNLLAAVVSAASQSSRNDRERLSAFKVLTHLLKPGYVINQQFWDQPNSFGLGLTSDIAVKLGDPITAADSASALQALDDMAANDANSKAKLVAKRLAALLRA